ncbi:hypothetical protein, partial [Natronomonas sp.]|uniref:hypothetical protein n=1 Tax=Natronomonas sp. TaxID=2184060 RepID=UPI003974A4C4
SALGILRKLEESGYREPVPLTELPDGLRERVTGGRPLIVTKTNAESTVHRPARMDYVGVEQVIDLQPGWNSIYVRLDPNETDIATHPGVVRRTAFEQRDNHVSTVDI